MRVMFAAGDVGGARALLPVARLACQRGHTVLAMAHGVLRQEGDEAWSWVPPGRFPQAENLDAMFYATSVADWTAFRFAQHARAQGVPLIHVLDNWSNYANRLLGPDSHRLVPDVYAVMDDLAAREAIASGVPADSVIVTGHPGLTKLRHERHTVLEGATSTEEDGSVGSQQHIMFVSEPALKDSGQAGRQGSRGYDEIVVSHLLLRCLSLAHRPDQPLARLSVVPHPREDRNGVEVRWTELASQYTETTGSMLDWQLTPPDQVRETLHGANVIVGMTSILLYEAWLLGKHAVSVQPNLQNDELRALAERDGLVFCDSEDAAIRTLPSVLSHFAQRELAPRPDLRLHEQASTTLLALAERCSGIHNRNQKPTMRPA
ncbi:MAG: hypothetical protein AAGD23_09820 [Pseudomonadota bacterium]